MERVQRAAQSAARSAFAAAVSSKPGPKTLFVERALYDNRTSSALCLRAFADNAFFSEHGVRDVVPYPSQRAEKLLHPNAAPRAAVFLMRGVSARGAIDLIRMLHTRRQDKPEHPPLNGIVLVTPRASPTIQRILDRSGGPSLTVKPLPLGFLPFDADVLSLDWPSAYRELVLDGDTSAILGAAGALVSLANNLRLRYAPIRSAGPAAGAVAEEILETHGRRYAKTGPRRQNGFNSGASVANSADDASSVRDARPPLSIVSPPRSDVPDDASVVDSEYFAFSDTSTAIESRDGRPKQSPTYGQAKRRRTDVNLILLDRGVDIVSSLLTQWTYEGLIDEALGFGNNMLIVPLSELETEQAKEAFEQPKESAISSAIMKLTVRADSDSLFREVRDMNFWAASDRIGAVAADVRKYYSERPDRETAKIPVVREYVLGLGKKMNDHKRASEHVALTAEISERIFYHIPFKERFKFERELLDGGSASNRKEFVGDSIAQGESLEHVLRLACLWSVTSSGIDSELFNFIRREIIATYGLKAMPILANLERAGLLVRSVQQGKNGPWLSLRGFGGGGNNNNSSKGKQEENSDICETQSVASTRSSGSSTAKSGGAPPPRQTLAVRHSWHFARAALRLVENFDPERESKKIDAALSACAPYLGYTPLSVRLMEAALSKDGWAGLPPSPPHKPLLPIGHVAVEHRAPPPPNPNTKSALPFDSIVLFVGGVMRAEISAVRMAARAAGKRVLVLTTHVVSSDEFIASFAEQLQ